MMSDEDFLLNWNDHHTLFFSGAEELWKSEECTDVTLAAGSKLFPAHRLVLSVCSPYFRQLFRRLGTDRTVIYLKDVDASHLELLLNYMYKGEINVKEQELMTVLNTAQGLEIRGLTQSDKPNNGDSPVKPLSTKETVALPTPNTSKSKKRKFSPNKPLILTTPSVDTTLPVAKQDAAHEVEDWNNFQSVQKMEDIVVEDHDESHDEVIVEDYEANIEEVEGDIEDYEGSTEVVECLIEEYDTNPQDIAHENEHAFYDDIADSDPIEADKSDICEISNITGGYSCQYCNKTFTQRRNLQVHVKTLHEGIRIPCIMCDHTSATKSNLRKHMANKHNILT